MSLDAFTKPPERSRFSGRSLLWIALIVLWALYGVATLRMHFRPSLLAFPLAIIALLVGRFHAKRQGPPSYPAWFVGFGLLAAIPVGLLLTLSIRMDYILDYEVFLQLAKSIYTTGKYEDWYGTVAWRPPGTALCYGLPMRLGLSPQLSVWLVNSLLFVAVFGFIRACHRVFPVRSHLFGIVPGALVLCLATLPFLLLPISHLPSIATMIGVLWLIPTSAELLRRTPPVRWLAAGILIGLSTLFRANLILQFPVICVALLTALGPRPSLAVGRRFLLAAVACLAGVLLAIIPWSIRNYRVLGRPVLISTNGGMVFYSANWPARPSEQGMYHEELHKEIVAEVPDEVDRDRVAWRKGLEAIRARPMAFVTSYLYRIPRLLGDPLFPVKYIGYHGEGPSYLLSGLKLAERAVLIGFWCLWLQILVSAGAIRARVLDPETIPWPQVSLLLVVSVSSIFECSPTYQLSFLPFVLATWLGSPTGSAKNREP
ncbi:MAG: hypothetical protein SFU56_21795 [Capsulimonadales bacterium]|nr:hypothetical protein [Capsulimonadales bacterium]